VAAIKSKPRIQNHRAEDLGLAVSRSGHPALALGEDDPMARAGSSVEPVPCLFIRDKVKKSLAQVSGKIGKAEAGEVKMVDFHVL
jgi:hypothetical protein